MSIAPVQSSPPNPIPQSETASVRTQHAPSTTTPQTPEEPSVVQSVSGTPPKTKTTVEKVVPTAYVLPEDVVEVHQDPDIKDQVIVEYLNQSKNVVLQVPSNQELGVERGIAEEFQQAAKVRADESAAVTGTGGGTTHGD